MVRRLTTDQFVTKAKKIHGDLYDYSNTRYVRSGDKLEIVCRVHGHGPFLMTPDNHTHKSRPQGCPKCGREKAGQSRRKTTEEFLLEVREVHGDRYGLHLVEYVGAKVPVVLVCEEHNEFEITPTKIVSSGQGCRECGILKSARTREIARPGESLLDIEPELAQEYSPFNRLGPEQVNPGSSRRVQWVCSACKNVWWTSVEKRVAGTGCPTCNTGRLHSDGKNSMFHTHPEIAKELQPNSHGTSRTLVTGTGALLPWKCSVCEHEWTATGNARKSGSGCGVCKKGFLHSRGDNSMAKTHPNLATELQPNEFGGPEELIAGTHSILPWKCVYCGNRWNARGSSRKKGTGCPACQKKSVHSDGSNSMASTHPRLAEELLPNDIGTAKTLIAGTNKRLPWKCSVCGHEWRATGNNRVAHANCPACVNQELHSEGRNSLAFRLPEIAKELLPNEYGTAEELIYISGIKVPWRCSSCGNEWDTTIRNRERGSGCPSCNRGDLMSDGSNSLSNTHPILAVELQENEFGTADELVAGSNKVVPWKCADCGYTWSTSISHRAYSETGCPKCAPYGFQPHLPAQYYVHEILNSLGDVVYYKGGISGDWLIRLRSLRKSLPDHLSYNNIEVMGFEEGGKARELEKILLGVEDIRYPKRSFDGGSELFRTNPLEYARARGILT